MTADTLFGLHLDALTMDDTLLRCGRALEDRRPMLIGVVNAAKIVHARHDQVLRESLTSADIVLADGQAVVWASRFLGRPVPERVAGIDLFEKLLEVAGQEHRSIYLLGASPTVLAEVVRQVGIRYPGAVVAGSRDGYFADEDAQRIADEIRDCRPDMLFLGMSSPRKETFLAAHSAAMQVPVMHGVGGSFDIMAGVVQRAPERWQRSGFEWLYRVLQEPRRMWRRYLVTNTAFLALTVRERIRPVPAYPCPAPRAASPAPASPAGMTVIGPVGVTDDRLRPIVTRAPAIPPP